MSIISDFFNIKYNNIIPQKGSFLIAEPSSSDIFFSRSVILLTDYEDKEENVGFIINKPLETTIGSILENLENLDSPMFLGGPCELDSIFFIHRLGSKIQNSKKISSNLYWSIDLERIIELYDNKKIDGSELRFFLGYSGWEKGQLKTELENNKWLVAEPDCIESIWNIPPMFLWNKLIQTFGNEYSRWKDFPINPNMN